MGNSSEEGFAMNTSGSETRLSEELLSLRRDDTSLQSFQEWVGAYQSEISQLVSPGIYLRLRRGTKEEVMHEGVRLVGSCNNCKNVYPEGDFVPRVKHEECAARVEVAVSAGVLELVRRPAWIGHRLQNIGSDRYFRCKTCDSVWTHIAPERHDDGLWERIA